MMAVWNLEFCFSFYCLVNELHLNSIFCFCLDWIFWGVCFSFCVSVLRWWKQRNNVPNFWLGSQLVVVLFIFLYWCYTPNIAHSCILQIVWRYQIYLIKCIEFPTPCIYRVMTSWNLICPYTTFSLACFSKMISGNINLLVVYELIVCQRWLFD